MTKQQRARRRRTTLLLILSMALLAGGAVGGTVAWLTARTDPVVNTFTVGDIDITLTETKKDFKMVPGNTIDKDPKVTVKANSEACWLFVKVEESENLGTYISWTIDGNWTILDATTYPGVFYRSVDASDKDQVFPVLSNNQVKVKDSVTKAHMAALEGAALPKLTFTAYAVQKDGFANATLAWAEAQTAPPPTP